MLEFVSTPWHVISAAFVFLLGAIFCFWQRRMFRFSFPAALALYVWHTAFCIGYYLYSINDSADSSRYYLSHLSGSDFRLGTGAVMYVTGIFVNALSLSYGGAFLLYNIVGFIGMLAFASALRQTTASAKQYAIALTVIVLLLPGLSFWSVAIGKDAFTFMGAGLACWAAMKVTSRYPAMIIAFLAFLIARPHMAGIFAASLAIASVLFLRAGMAVKFILAGLMLPISILAVVVGLDFAGVSDPTSLESFSERIEVQQGRNLGGGSSVVISEMSVPMRMFTYLFRPMIVDAPGVMGLVISFENIILLAVFLAGLFAAHRRRSSLSPFQIAFFGVFAAVSLVVLANSTANLGIAIRQKWMFLPMMLMLAMSFVGQPRKLVRRASQTRRRGQIKMDFRSTCQPVGMQVKRRDA